MESNKQYCIINANNGVGWYPRGSQRLRRSLIEHGFTGDFLQWNEWPNEYFNKNSPYNIKACAFMEAINMGYKIILWLDCSVWAIDNPDKLFEVINNDGYYFWTSGYNCAQTCSDKSLEYFNIDRNTAETFPDCSTSMFGVNLDNELAQRFLNDWMQSCRDGVFEGSRLHDGQSQDPRFLFHRQDQSAASLIINKLGMKMHNAGEYSSYYDPKRKDSVVFTMRGM